MCKQCVWKLRVLTDWAVVVLYYTGMALTNMLYCDVTAAVHSWAARQGQQQYARDTDERCSGANSPALFYHLRQRRRRAAHGAVGW